MNKIKKKYCDEFRHKVSPLHHMMATGSTEAVESFLRQWHRHVDITDSAGQTPLYYAIFRGYRHGTNLLLERGVNVNFKDNEENTPLHFAVKKGNMSIVSDLVKNGADLKLKNNYGQTVLQYAIVWNYSKTFEPMVKLLLDSGANVHSKDKDCETPLHSAAGRKDSSSVCLSLLAKGAKINCRDKRGNTPLHVASMRQCLEVIVTLMDKGADIGCENNFGDTPLHVAVQSKVPLSIKLLLDRKADIDARNHEGQTALHVATEKGYDEIIKLLIDLGANLEVKDKLGYTALHCAARHYDSSVELLLKHGAEVNVLNVYDETPLIIAFSYKKSSIQSFLDWGTTVDSKNYFILPETIFKDQLATLMEHLVKLKCVKISFETNADKLPWQDFLVKLISSKSELEKLKAKRFGRHSLHDIFVDFSDPTFLSNSDLKGAIVSPDFENQYPIYSSLLKVSYEKAEKRFNLLNTAQAVFKVPLPNEIQRKILTYLDEKSLLKTIKSFQSL